MEKQLYLRMENFRLKIENKRIKYGSLTHTRIVQRKYKTETGESMEKPGKKLKKSLIITGVTGAVYASLKYLLPLVVPFLIAYGIALFLKRPVMWLHRHIYWTWKGRRHFFPVAAAGMLLLFWMFGLAAAGCYIAGCKLAQEIRELAEVFPDMWNAFDMTLTKGCYKIENEFHIKSGLIPALVKEWLLDALSGIRKTAMPYLVGNSMNLFQNMIRVISFVFVTVIAVILSLQEMEELRMRREHSLFRQEFAMIGMRIVNVGKAYIKTQGLIMAATMIVCSIGLFLMKNPYYLLIGIVIGILDALPIFGTGTVFIPWIVVKLFQKDWKAVVGLAVIYGICYFLREFMEAKLMGNEVGMTPLETLMAIYIGLLLFGLWGFILGPVGLLLIEDFVKICCDAENDSI